MTMDFTLAYEGQIIVHIGHASTSRATFCTHKMSLSLPAGPCPHNNVDRGCLAPQRGENKSGNGKMQKTVFESLSFIRAMPISDGATEGDSIDEGTREKTGGRGIAFFGSLIRATPMEMFYGPRLWNCFYDAFGIQTGIARLKQKTMILSCPSSLSSYPIIVIIVLEKATKPEILSQKARNPKRKEARQARNPKVKKSEIVRHPTIKKSEIVRHPKIKKVR